MITYKTLAEKFEDKGISLRHLMLNLPQIPIFDPSCLELSANSREDLSKRFFECNKWRFDHYREKLEELDVYIDHQNYR